MYRFLIIILLFLTSFFIGCNQPFYDHSVTFDESGWAESDSVVFDFNIYNTAIEYDIIMDVTHSAEYPYENFYVKIESYTPEGLAQTQIKPINLSSGNGKWYGECNDMECILSLAFITRSKFNLEGKYRIKLTQYSRINPIKGIKQLRLHMYEHKTKK